MYTRVIAVDFDGTLCENKFPEIGEARWHVINELLNRQCNGWKIILWTCREGKLLQDALDASAKWGILYDAVNDSLASWKEQFGNNPRKIGATEYWDDRAVAIPPYGTYKTEIE